MPKYEVITNKIEGHIKKQKNKQKTQKKTRPDNKQVKQNQKM